MSDTALPEFSLKGSTALVTGAGRGIGRTLALGLAEAGADIVAMSRSAEELNSVADDIRDRGREAATVVCDVTKTDAMRTAIGDLPKLDILINNAGTNIPEPFLDVREENLDTLLTLNVRAAFLVAQAAARRMLQDSDRKSRGGAIVHISSQLGHVSLIDRSVYSMTKHAIEGMNKAMATELATTGIRVNSVAPTWVETPMTGPALAEPAFRDFILSCIPMGNLAQMRDITGAVVFLSSPAAAMITGTSLLVDGGWTAR
ncbi:MAG: Gluconate 5-dehydrogenase [Alphaproteobacteria bacterium MarineAlpha4_Bin2]|nr:MAG: Gluconate 5-dehydrogenase [Alphaproteobacteria bacterium MarineAlpha4_Bin2]